MTNHLLPPFADLHKNMSFDLFWGRKLVFDQAQISSFKKSFGEDEARSCM